MILLRQKLFHDFVSLVLYMFLYNPVRLLCFISPLMPFHMYDPWSQAPPTPSWFMAGTCHDCVVLTLQFKSNTGSIKLFSHTSFKWHGMCSRFVDATGNQIRVGVHCVGPPLGSICLFWVGVLFFFVFLNIVFLCFPGSPKQSLMERSLLLRRRSTIWSQSTLKCVWWTLTSKTWWCCPERSILTNGWPATVSKPHLSDLLSKQIPFCSLSRQERTFVLLSLCLLTK